MFREFNAIIVDPDLESRSKLKTAAVAVDAFKTVYPVRSIKEGTFALEGPDKYDVVFISYHFEKGEVEEFIASQKETTAGEDRAYILVLKPKEGTSQAVVTNVLSGADGFLFEPYSPESVRETAAIAAKIKAENEVKREYLALTILAQSLSKHLEKLAFDLTCEKDLTRAWKEAQKAAEPLRQLNPERLEMFYDVLGEVFGAASPLPSVSYSGPSKRLKQKLEQQIRDKMTSDIEEMG